MSPDFAPRHFALVDALDQAAIATDPHGRITHWNRSAARLYGWSADEVIGKPIVDVTPSDLARAQAEEIMRALTAGSVWSGEFPVRGRSGEPFVASVTDVPLGGDDGIAGILGLSAPSRSPADLVELVHRFVAAANVVWPERVSARMEIADAIVPASEPHIAQLLSLLILHHGAALDAGTAIELQIAPAKESIFVDFGLHGGRPSVWIRIGLQERRKVRSLLRSAIEAAQPTNHAAALVRMVGGTLLRADTPEGLTAWHLLLPLR
jgi:PAS domain S-box-containing protein